MKKYLVFAVSFIVLFLIIQTLVGYVMTLLYTPAVNSAWYQAVNASENIVIDTRFTGHAFVIAFIAASIAFFIPEKLVA